MQEKNEMNGISSLEQAKQYAAANGYTLSPKDIENITRLQEAEQSRLAALQRERRPGMVERFNAAYPRFLRMLIGLGEILLTLSQTVIIAFGVPAVLVLLLIVEQQRVVHGIGLFEVDTALSAFAAWALVLLNLTLEFTIEYIEHQAQYQAARDMRFSLRIWGKNALYTLGWGDQWQEQPLSPAQRYRRLLRLVTFTILALALAGSMHAVIEKQVGAWHVAIIDILTDSSLSEIITWLGGLLFAAAAVLAAQGLSRYVAIRCVEIVSQMNSQPQAVAAESLDSVAVQYILAQVAAKQAKKVERKAATSDAPLALADIPEVQIYHPSTNGHHSATV